MSFLKQRKHITGGATFVNPDQRVLSFSDLTLVGYFKSPTELANSGGPLVNTHFTVRRVGDTLKTLWLGSTLTAQLSTADNNNELWEGDYPGYNAVLGSAPTSTATHNYGNGFADLLIYADGSGGIQATCGGIKWDERNQCLWLTYQDIYGGGNDPFLIRGEFDDVNHTIAWYGPFRFSGTSPNSTATAGAKQAAGGVFCIPQAYGDAYLDGATIASGAGASSIAVAMAYAPVMWAPTNTPTSATPAHPGGSDFAATCLIGGDSSHRYRRPGDYLDLSCGGSEDVTQDPDYPSRTDLSGYFTAMCGSGQGYWMDWDTIRGVMMPVIFPRGHNWYATALNVPDHTCLHGKTSSGITGPVALIDPVGDAAHVYGQGYNWEPFWYFYAPEDLVPVAGGNAFDVPASSWGYLDLHDSNVFFYKHADSSSFNAMGSTIDADETLRLLFVPQPHFVEGGGGQNGLRHIVNVYSVAA